MTRREAEGMLHDYLDDRLDGGDRERFERFVASDEEMARRIREYRLLGRALREMPADLPVGLVTRARARFEESRPRPVRRRLWIWESIGVAAAAMIVVALLVVSPVRRPEVPIDAVTARPEPPPARQDADPDSGLAAAKPSAPAPAAAPFPRSRRDEADENDENEKKKEEGLGGTRQNAAPSGRLREERAATAVEPESGFSPSPDVALQDADDRGVRESVSGPADFKTARAGVAHSSVRSHELTSRFLLPSSPTVIESPEEKLWRDLLAGPDGASVSILNPDFRRERVVFIGGPGYDVSCNEAKLRYEGNLAVITLRGRRSLDPVPRGVCMIVIPADDTPVRVDVESHGQP